MFEQELLKQAELIVTHFKKENLKLVTAESCTGGLLAGLITSISGASSIFDRGFVTYSNEAKIENLNVNPSIIDEFGAVSLECAKAMAQGALKNSSSDIALAITGIAGPKSDETNKKVGLVYIAIATRKETKYYEFNFSGNREEIRRQSLLQACSLLLNHTEYF